MATGNDQSIYQGSSLDYSLETKQPEAAKQKVKEIKESRNTRASGLRAGAKELLELIDQQIKKEDKMEVLRGKATAHIKNGEALGPAMQQELVYEAGRIDAFNQVRALLKSVGGKK